MILLEGGLAFFRHFRISERKRRKSLTEIGVEVRTSSVVTRVERARCTWVRKKFRANTVFWAAGNAAHRWGKMLGVPIDRVGRVLVNRISRYPVIRKSSGRVILPSSWRSKRQVPGVCPAPIRKEQRRPATSAGSLGTENETFGISTKAIRSDRAGREPSPILGR